jgi:hypothetical protein
MDLRAAAAHNLSYAASRPAPVRTVCINVLHGSFKPAYSEQHASIAHIARQKSSRSQGC